MDMDSIRTDAEFTEWADCQQWCEECDNYRRPSEVHDYGFGWCMYLQDFVDGDDYEECEGYGHV